MDYDEGDEIALVCLFPRLRLAVELEVTTMHKLEGAICGQACVREGEERA
jgi:hypothetical protein